MNLRPLGVSRCLAALALCLGLVGCDLAVMKTNRVLNFGDGNTIESSEKLTTMVIDGTKMQFIHGPFSKISASASEKSGGSDEPLTKKYKVQLGPQQLNFESTGNSLNLVIDGKDLGFILDGMVILLDPKGGAQVVDSGGR